MKSIIALISILSVFTTVHAQDLPGFEIYMMDVVHSNADVQVVNISNHVGYDNQPSFTPNGKEILFASVRNSDQSDIYAYDIQKKKIKQYTHTTESEYSPEITPDKKHISVVRVEADSTQRMWLFTVHGKKPHCMIPAIKQVGYYGRINEAFIALFLLPEPFTLITSTIKKQDSVFVAQNIGRCIKKIPGESAMSFIVKDSETEWTLRRLDLQTNAITILSKIPPVSEDYAWTPTGTQIYMARGSKIVTYDYGSNKQWHDDIDMSKYGIEKIFRIAISGDGSKIAFVAEEPQKTQ